MARFVTQRVFIAASLPEGLLRNIRQFVDSVGHLEGMRFVNVDGMHLTIKFVGDLDVMRVHELARVMNEVTNAISPVGLQLGGLGVFPSPDNPKVLWAGVQGNVGPISAMAEALDLRCKEFGIRPEGRRYTPHVTLARAKGRPDARAVQELLEKYADHDFGKFSVKNLYLYNSTVMPAGAVYEKLASAPLAGITAGTGDDDDDGDGGGDDGEGEE